MGKKISRYDSLAPVWLRITRDIWVGIGSPLVTYLQVFNIPTQIDDIISATIGFISSILIVTCMVWKSAKSNTDDNSPTI
jgi:hypothetical protein|tara:strand:- start:1917 stop:2156 length:240 start_codon:yes stop_codon:yes gene_type:complete